MESDNRVRWNGEPGRYEVWYLTLNHLPSRTGFWIRWTLDAPVSGPAHCALWFAHFDAEDPRRTFRFHREFPISSLKSSAAPFEARIADCVLRDGAASGVLEHEGRRVEFELAWTPGRSSHRHLPAFAYRGKFADTQVLTPSLNTAFRGRIRVDGRLFELDGAPGCQTHLWGRKHAHAWAWSHCNAFAGEPDAAFESLTVRLKRLGMVLPPLTMASLYFRGREYHFRHLLFARGGWDATSYRLKAWSPAASLTAEFRCRPEDIVVAPYVDPDGDEMACRNTEVGDARVTLSVREGERYELTADKSAHFEYADRHARPV